MATLYIQYPQTGGGGSTGSQTGVPYNVGVIDSALANANGGVIGSFSLFFQSAQGNTPGLVSSITQVFNGVKKFSSATLFSNGSLTSPGLAFTIESSSGIYYIGTSSWAMGVSGNQAMSFVMASGGGFANVGLGGAASTSPLFPLSAQRTQDGGFLTLAFSNLSSVAGSGGRLQALVDNGVNSAEVIATSINTAAPDVYAGGKAVFRSAGNMTGINFLNGAADGTTKFYIGPNGTNTEIKATVNSGGFYAQTLVAAPQLRVGSVSMTSSTSGASYALRLPGAQGSAGQVMSNDGAGFLSWSSPLTNPMTTAGDMIIGSGAGVAQRLALGTPFQMLGVSNAGAFPSWQTLTVGAMNSLTKVANGAVIGSFTITLQTADATSSGLVSSGDQAFAGVKTFNQPIILAANGSSSYQAGGLVFDNLNQSPTFYNGISSISLQVGQEQWVRVYNNSSATIVNGRAVYVNGAFGSTPTIALAIATTQSTSQLLGVATHDIANGGFGMVTQQGKVNGIDTSAYGAGQRVWLSASSAGFFQVTDPLPPSYSVFVGYPIDIGSTTGSLFLSGIRQGAQVPFVNPMTTTGDFIVGSAGGVPTRYALVGSTGMSMTRDSSSSLGVSWGVPRLQLAFPDRSTNNVVFGANDQAIVSYGTSTNDLTAFLPDPILNTGKTVVYTQVTTTGSGGSLNLRTTGSSTMVIEGSQYNIGQGYLFNTRGETLQLLAVASTNSWVSLSRQTETPWISFIPTNTQGLGSCTSHTLRWRRDGPDMLITGGVITGTGTASEAQLSIPEGLTVDTGVISSGFELAGTVAIGNNAAVAIYVLAAFGANFINFGQQAVGTTGLAKVVGTGVSSNTTRISINARVPISGWGV